MKARERFWKADKYFSMVMKRVSYAAPVCLLFVAVVATVNIITTKLLHWGVPSVNDWITYLLIPIVYLSLPYAQLDRGMVAVDFVSKHMPRLVYDILVTVWELLFSLISFYIARNMMGLMVEYIRLHKRSSVLAGSFPLWPLALILGLGIGLYGLSTIWIAIRRFVKPLPEVDGGEEGKEELE